MKKQFSALGTKSHFYAFTLIELLVSIAVITIMIFMVAQLMSNATPLTRTANKHIDTDTQARVVLDRIASDFARMLKRTDVDYYVKAPAGYKNPNSHGQGKKLQTGQQGNDQIAFFTHTPGYYPSGAQSPISLIAYRVNNNSGSPSYLMLERMGKGLLWNGVSTSNTPLVFLPLTIDATWPAATNNDNSAKSQDSAYETIGPQVFRFEYYYLLKDGTVTDVPAENWVSTQSADANINAFGDVEVIAVAIAVIDPASRAMISQTQLSNLMSDLADFKTAPGKGVGNQTKYIGFLEAAWETAVETAAQTGQTSDGSAFPPAAASAVRIYNRYFDLKTLPGF